MTGPGDTATGSIEIDEDGIGNAMILAWVDDTDVEMSVEEKMIPSSTSTISSAEPTETEEETEEDDEDEGVRLGSPMMLSFLFPVLLIMGLL